MKKKYRLILFFVLCFSAGFTQLNNSWIQYNQPYFKCKIASTGIYRISPQVLQQAGINLNAIHPSDFQIFGRGKEIPLFIQGENDPDGIFNGNDYIEFYAQKNDGWADSLVVENGAKPLNEYTSFFSDSIYYFLTWNTNGQHLRYAIETDTLAAGIPTSDYFFAERINNYTYDYGLGVQNSAGSYSPEFEAIEGFSTAYQFYPGFNPSPQLSTPNFFSSGPAAECRMVFMTNTDDPNTQNDNGVKLYLGDLTGSLLLDEVWNGIQTKRFNFSIPSGQLLSPTTYLLFFPTPTAGSNAKTIGASSLSCYYPHTNVLEGQSIYTLVVPDNLSGSKQVYRLSNFSPGNDTISMLDITSRKKYVVTKSGGLFTVVVPNTGARKYCQIYNNSIIRQIPSLEACGNNGYFSNYFVQEPNCDFLLVSHTRLMTAAQQYANYKNSKGFHTVLADVNELYDQYAFGIPKNPLAMRGFAAHALAVVPAAPKGMFLMGKSILSFLSRNNTSYNALNLIPTWGIYGSDEIITAGIGGATGYAPQVPVGRLAATTTQHILDYLSKLQQFDNQPKDLWMKEVLHFSGGASLGEQQQHSLFMDTYKTMLEDTLFGGHVTTYSKSTTAPIEIAASDSIRRRIESGVSIMNFFGHAAGSSFDVSPEPPDQYNINGRYPLIMANSCYVGDLHQPPDATYQFVSEKYILTPNKGAIAFIAQSSPGLAPPGFYYTRAFYDNLGRKKYGASIGECIKSAIEDVQNITDDVLKETCLTMTLHGDPTVSMYPFENPDYVVDNNSISITPAIVNTATDSFKVKVTIKNVGNAKALPLLVSLKRYLPDSLTPRVYVKNLSPVFFSGETTFTLPVYTDRGAGLNQLEIELDPLNSIAETNEQNNRISVPLTIQSDEIYPVYPYQFGIVDTSAIFLKASTGDLMAPERTFVFDIDTVPSFSSPFRRRNSLTKSGGVIQWALPFLLTDSTVYYWRVSPDSIAGSIGYKWKKSSFQYIRKRKGWEQAHGGQFAGNTLSLISYDNEQRKFAFDTLRKTLTCFTWSAPSGSIPSDADLFATEYRINQKLIESAGISYSAAIHVAVMDSATLEPWEIRYSSNGVTLNPNNNFGNANDNYPINGHTRYFVFYPTSASQAVNLKNMLLNGIPNGSYVLLYTWINGSFQSWADTSLFTVLETMGADSARYLPNYKSWAFFARKGYPSTAVERFSPGNGRFRVSLTGNMEAIVNQGSVFSPLIGPAQRWDSLSWKSRISELPQTDTASFELYGIRYSGQKDTLQRIGSFSGNLNLNGLSAETYPYLQMRFFTKDATHLTPAQLKRWHIFYKTAPECALNPNGILYLSGNKLQQGEPLQFKTLIQNISDQPMDSLLVKFWLEDQNKQITPLPFPRSDSLRAGFAQVPVLDINTRNLFGNYKLWVNANPFYSNLNRYDQPEQYHFNNTLYVPFSVGKDLVNPALDVTFNGARIMDGEVVSPKPEIVISLKDENKFLALNDTGAFNVYLQYPGESAGRRIYFQTASGEQMRFSPASLPNNSCRIHFNPFLTTDGIYQLRVQAKDASGNLSGKNEYSIRFEVINKSSITRIMNYPNPFSTSTRFVFTLTGMELPTWLKIQILSVSGKIVREITLDELGPLRIGKNITEYSWDGTDSFGDKLANGLYLYKVFCNINGESIEQRQSGADAYFTKEFGKMYLLR
jgi:hypothetical protein